MTLRRKRSKENGRIIRSMDHGSVSWLSVIGSSAPVDLLGQFDFTLSTRERRKLHFASQREAP